ncbi:MAG: TrkH family potassium uptake protein [Myxococcales bacterium]|nr:TrkH family potassium uptake protein [Myxococcales bacterium]MCB9521338.1 TrkH family potassium uptake protein [Myxococcales bacterium]
MRLPVVLAVVGELLLIFGAAFGPPLVLAALDRDAQAMLGFGGAMAISFALGSAAHYFFRQWRDLRLHRAEAFAVVASSWMALAVIGGIPYIAEGLPFFDALFESMSGLTTTGATVLTDFSQYDRPFFLWRGMEQWIGGLGVIALFVVVLPQLGVAGRQLFFAEASSAGGSPLPQVRKASMRLWILYAGLTATLIAALILTGMPAFDAVCNAFATLAAGGFSPHPLSIAGYENPAAEWVLIPFMLISGTSFTLLYHALTKRSPRVATEDPEFRVFWGASIALGVGVAVAYSGRLDLDTLRTGLFQVASLISSTGFASVDFELWGDSAKALLVVAMLINGCAGSAAGGPKVVRLILFAKYVSQGITRTLHPHAILPYKYKSNVLPGRVMRAVLTLVILYFGAYLFFGTAVVLQGLDLETGFSAALACVGNIGPGFRVVGPMGSYGGFSALTKFTLTCAMWVGRLEIVTVLVLLHPDVWRNIRLHDRRGRAVASVRPRRSDAGACAPSARR